VSPGGVKMGKLPKSCKKAVLAFRKPPFYSLNYGDGMKAKVRRMKEEV
jgi:hypothetical protein